METTRAILLRKTKLTETSLIVTWLSPEHGRIKTVAKGARQPKSRFAGLLDLFFECEIAFARSRRSDLHVLREVSVRETHGGIAQDVMRVSLGAYFVELLEVVSEPEHGAPDLYDLLLRGCGYLKENPASKKAMLHFEAEMARLLGIQHPDLTAAVAIGRVYHRLPTVRAGLLGKLP